jgi:pimeloyl-ACP methyl ester carboxylesterase
MIKAQDGILEVPGATLFHKVRGSGPVLLILQGGGGDAEGSEALVRLLADTYTMVTYDRRGLSRSSIQDPSPPISIEVHSEDAHRLLLALSSEPAFVLRASIGALIALDLVTRHPEQVRALVAFEPGIADLLPEDERARANQTHVELMISIAAWGCLPPMKRMAGLSGVNRKDLRDGVHKIACRITRSWPWQSDSVRKSHIFRADTQHISCVRKHSRKHCVRLSRTQSQFSRNRFRRDGMMAENRESANILLK